MSTVDRDIERLSAVFKQGPLREWPVEDIAKDKIMRFAETYLMMARTGYRPAAPSDGLGNFQLDEERLYREAAEYALKFNREEDGRSFRIGCSNYSTNRAYVLSIEAARLLASGSDARNVGYEFSDDNLCSSDGLPASWPRWRYGRVMRSARRT